MRKVIVFGLLIILASVFGLIFLFKNREKQTEQPAETMNQEIKSKQIKEVSLTTVYDNYQAEPSLETGWGFSCLIEIDDQKILFDTGADSPTLLANMEKLSIQPTEIKTVVISHNHADHTGGLEGFLEANGRQTEVYRPTAFSQPTEIADQVYSTGPLGDSLKEQSLAVKSPKGLVIVTGCSHPGIIKIIEFVREQFSEQTIYLVLGGFHLFAASEVELEGIINDFRRLSVQKAAPCHCSGDRCRELFEQEYQADFIANGVGKIIEIR